VEVIARSIFTYVVLLVAARHIGKRVAGQMSVMKLTIMVTLGADIVVPLQAPDRGILPAVLILGVAIVYQRGLTLWSFENRWAELTIQRDVTTVVQDGCLDLGAMRRTVLSRESLFAILRQRGLKPRAGAAGVPEGRGALQPLPGPRPAAGPVPDPANRPRRGRRAVQGAGFAALHGARLR
jgi:uncharacterized membrane protein YcaP (DUF421 family)